MQSLIGFPGHSRSSQGSRKRKGVVSFFSLLSFFGMRPEDEYFSTQGCHSSVCLDVQENCELIGMYAEAGSCLATFPLAILMVYLLSLTLGELTYFKSLMLWLSYS